MFCPFYPEIAVFLCKRKLSGNVFLGHHFANAPSKTTIQTSTSVQKGKISQEILKIGGIMPIPDAGVPSDALKKRGCFRVKALE